MNSRFEGDNDKRSKCQQLFVDDSFPHTKQSIGELLESDADAVKGSLPTEIVWLRPAEMATRDGSKSKWCVMKESKVSDIEQGALGDCWLMSALGLVADQQNILDNILVSKSYDHSGMYKIRVCIDGIWKVVTVDDYFPCRKDSKSLAFASGRRNQLWVPLLEKALAKSFGCYTKLRSGRAIEGLVLLTGAPTEEIREDDIPDHDKRWEKIINAKQAGFLMAAGTSLKKMTKNELTKLGLVEDHCYSILDVRQEGEHRLLRLRNPWGRFGWLGDWSDKWDGWPEDLKAKLLPKKEEPGAFWISFKSFTKYFKDVEIARVRDKDWIDQRFPIQMGGAYEDGDVAICLTVKKNTDVCLTLYQAGGTRPTTADLVDQMICVHKFQDGKVGEFISRSPRDSDIPVSTPDLKLTAGKYIAICHSLKLIGEKKTVGCLALLSSCAISAEPVPCTKDMYLDSLVEMMLGDKEVDKYEVLKGGCVSRTLTQHFGFILMMDNNLDDLWLLMKNSSDKSSNMLSSRGDMTVIDSIAPNTRQIVMIITKNKAGEKYELKHESKMTLAKCPVLGGFEGVPDNSEATNIPSFKNSSVAWLHKAIPLESLNSAKIKQKGWVEKKFELPLAGEFGDGDKVVHLYMKKAGEVGFELQQEGGLKKTTALVDLLICLHKVSSNGWMGELVARSARELAASVSIAPIALPVGHYVIVCHSMLTLAEKKIMGTLILRSPEAPKADYVKCPAGTFAESLTEMALKDAGKIVQPIPGITIRSVSKDFSGMLCLVENNTNKTYFQINIDSNGSKNVQSTRGSLVVSDIVRPFARQIIQVLTAKNNDAYSYQQSISMGCATNKVLGKLAAVPADAMARHSPAFGNLTIAKLHRERKIRK